MHTCAETLRFARSPATGARPRCVVLYALLTARAPHVLLIALAPPPLRGQAPNPQTTTPGPQPAGQAAGAASAPASPPGRDGVDRRWVAARRDDRSDDDHDLPAAVRFLERLAPDRAKRGRRHGKGRDTAGLRHRPAVSGRAYRQGRAARLAGTDHDHVRGVPLGSMAKRHGSGRRLCRRAPRG